MQRDKSNEAKIIKRIIKELTGIDTSNGVYYTKKELKKGLKMVRDQTIVDMIAEDVRESISRDLDRHFNEMMFGSLMGEDEEVKGVLGYSCFKDIASAANSEYIKETEHKCSNCDSNNLQSRGSFIWCRDCGKVE